MKIDSALLEVFLLTVKVLFVALLLTLVEDIFRCNILFDL